MQEYGNRDEIFVNALKEQGFPHPESLLDTINWVELERDEYLFKQGDVGDSMYVVVRGRIRIYVRNEDDTDAVEIASYSKGDIVGELALLADQPRAASVQAVRASELACLSRDDAEKLFSEPEFILPLSRLIAARAGRNEGKKHRPTVFGFFELTPCCSSDIVSQLTNEMSEISDVRTIRFADVPASIQNIANFDTSALRHWINDLEQISQNLVLIAEENEDIWNQEISEHADRLIWLVSATDNVDKLVRLRAQLRVLLTQTSMSESLLIFHASKPDSYNDFREWYSVTQYSAISHVFDRVSTQRVARLLVGKGNALILSGGGARAMGHIGVIRAMEECGIPIDQIGGTSVGGVIAAQYATGLTPAELLKLNQRFWHRLARQFTLPVVSVWSDHLLNEMFEEFFGDLLFEDLNLQGFVCVTNLDQCEVQYKNRGRVRDWCRASLSLPAMWPPYLDSAGELYVDGGVLDNLPVAGISQAAINSVVVSNVSRPQEFGIYEGAVIPSGGIQALAQKIRGNANFPSLGAIIYKTAVVGSLSQFNASLKTADVLIQPELPDCSINDYTKITQTEQQGHSEAMAALRLWK